MTREKMFFYIALCFIIGAPAIGFGLHALSSAYQAPEFDSTFWGMLILYMLFLDGVFSKKASEKTFYQISSHTLKDRLLFLAWVAAASILVSLFRANIDMVHKIPLLLTMTFVCYFSSRSFSPQVKRELREKLRYPK